jgi:hypothetical protein
MMPGYDMKTVYLDRDFNYPLHPRRSVRFRGGTTYARVLEIAAREIERHGAGRIVPMPSGAAGLPLVDCSHAFKPRK